MTRHGFSLAGLAAVLLGAAACGVNTSQSGKVKITSVDPDTGSMTGGATVTIAGSGFDDGTGNATVVFGTLEAEVLSVTEAAITAKLPAGTACGPVDVQVTNGNGSGFKTDGFAYEGGSGPLSLTSISPNTGELTGNTTVTVTGSGFTGGVGVLIGGAPLRNVTIVSDTELTGVTSPRTVGGMVSVVARNCSSQASLENGFVFVTGLNGGVVEMNLTDYVNPAQFAAPTPRDYIDPYVAVVAPTMESMLNPLPTNNTCTLNYSPPAGGALTFVDAGPQVHLQSGSQVIDLDAQIDTANNLIRYFYPQNDTTNPYVSARYVPGGVYDFGIDGSAEIAGFSIAGAFAVPTDYNVTAPNFFADTPITVSKSSPMNVTWQAPPANAGTKFQIFFIGYDSGNMSTPPAPTDEVLYCLTDDDGSYQIAASDLGKLSGATTQAIVLIRRRKESTFLNAANGSNITTLSYIQKVGYIRF